MQFVCSPCEGAWAPSQHLRPLGLRTAGRGTQRICCFGILVSFWGGGKGEIKACGLGAAFPCQWVSAWHKALSKRRQELSCGDGRAVCAPLERRMVLGQRCSVSAQVTVSRRQ